jgi:G:T-mismatch repair DNA endonuclease (very short patch repair protein)
MLHGVKFEKHKTITDGMGFYHQVDIFIEPNICVEIDGDYWHANPRIYHMDFVIKTRKNLVVTAKDIWFRDALVNNKLKQLSYQTIRIWESDLKINPRKEVFGILQLIEKESV